MVTVEERIPEQQWQPEEEENDATEEEATIAALKTRRSRKSSASAAAVAAAADAKLATSEEANGVHYQKPRNGGEEETGGDLEPEIKSEKNVYYDKDEGTEAVHESVTENSGLQVSATSGLSGDDGLEVTVNNNDVQKNQNDVFKNHNKYIPKDETFSGLRELLLEKSKEEHNSENNGFGVSCSFEKSGDNGGVALVNGSDGQRNPNVVVSNQCKEILQEESFFGLKSLAPDKLNGENEADVSSNDITAAWKDIDDGERNQNGVVSNQHKEILKEESIFGLKSVTPEKLTGENEADVSSNEITAACEDIDLTAEIDSETAHIDLDAVIKTQNTHDLYCPNCNSCITRRVILRKRKRHILNPDDDPKRNKGDKVILSEVDTISSHATSNERQDADGISLGDPLPSSGDEINRDSEPDVFRCLSCLSFFIPTGDGLKLFKIFGSKSKSEPEGAQVSESKPAEKKNWLSSMFGKESKRDDQVNDRVMDLDENIVQQSVQDKSPAQSLGSEAHVNDNTGESHKGGHDVVTSSKQVNDRVTDLEENIAQLSKEVKSLAQSPCSEAHVNDSTGESHKGGHNVVPSSKQDPKLLVDSIMEQTSERAEPIRPELHPVQQFSSSSITFSSNDNNHHTTQISWRTPMIAEESAEAATSRPQQDGLNILVSSSTDQKFNVAIETDTADDKDSVLLMPKPATVREEPDKNEEVDVDVPSENGQSVGLSLPKRPAFEDEKMKFTINDVSFEAFIGGTTGTNVDIHIEQPLKANNTVFPEDSLFSQHEQLDSRKDVEDLPVNSSAGGDTVVVIDRLVEQVVSQEALSTLSSAQPLLGSERTTDRRFHGSEIVKSIVYGGLAESITSLSVVSAAAGADTTTLNILALGLANLIGGLFVIFHDLWDLKSDLTRLDRYQELLGRRQNFVVHAVVAISSYLVFGLLPPVIYGFSFRASDDADFKLLAVAIASLLCIILLAIGKAYTQRPTTAYIKTVSYYVVLGFMASGVSYVAGGLIKKLMERLGWFDTSSGLAVGFPVLETTPVQSGWGSY